GSLEHEKDVKAAAIGALETSQSRAFGLDTKDGLYDGGAGKGYVLAVPVMGDGGRAAAAVTLLIEARSKAAVQSTLAMAEVLAGYVTLHAGRQEIKRMQQAGLSMELATRLIGAINAAPNFKGAAIRLVNDLTRQLGADRAALGWVGGASGDTVTVVALSDAEKFDTRTKMVRQIADAMDECADQEQAVLYPPPTAAGDVLLAQAITTAHRELAGGDSRLSLCSVPLRDGEKTLGVLLVELKRADDKPGKGGAGGAGGGLDLRGVEVLQAAMDLVTPVLAVKWSDSRLLPRRALGDARKALAWAVGPKHTVWKAVAVLVVAAALFVTFFHIEHRVGATVELRPRVQRTVAAPFDGVVARLGEGVKPGRIVKKGDVILEMDTRELLLQRDQADAKIQQATKQLSSSRSEDKAAESQMAQAALDRATAEKSLAETRLKLAVQTAPMDAVVIAGDLRDKVGASVKNGEELFLLAPLNDLIVVAKVDERDIALVKAGAKGEIATRARPSEGFDVTVETIVPMATPKDGKNLFEVRANLDETADWMRPGMEGQVRIDAGSRSLLWIGTRRVVDQVRLWLW
ncbi:MAG TPA: efflux RND transporter periplasmic adaptor subunit, partial [Phycisphaerales bacterium]|nr:efflux RND transporter periplasmic adaptor subunit [Phycisphaerales bacterium]